MNKTFLTINTLVLSIFYTSSFAAEVTLETEFAATQQQSQRLALLVAAQSDPDLQQSAAMELTIPLPESSSFPPVIQKNNQKEKKEDNNNDDKPVYRVSSGGPKRYFCTSDKCSFVAKSAVDVIRHFVKHANKRLFQCSFCDKNYKHETNLRGHEKTHPDSPNYQPPQQFNCTKCEKSYAQSSGLYKHQQKEHSGEERRYKCWCGQNFYDKSHFTEHQLTHASQKPFVCFCTASFAKKFDYERHQRSASHLTNMPNLYAAIPSKSLFARPAPY